MPTYSLADNRLSKDSATSLPRSGRTSCRTAFQETIFTHYSGGEILKAAAS